MKKEQNYLIVFLKLFLEFVVPTIFSTDTVFGYSLIHFGEIFFVSCIKVAQNILEICKSPPEPLIYVRFGDIY